MYQRRFNWWEFLAQAELAPWVCQEYPDELICPRAPRMRVDTRDKSGKVIRVEAKALRKLCRRLEGGCPGDCEVDIYLKNREKER